MAFKPGERTAGRKAGTPNKKTLLRLERQRQVEEAAARLAETGGTVADPEILKAALGKTLEKQKSPRDLGMEMLLIQMNICKRWTQYCFKAPPGSKNHDRQAWQEMRAWFADALRSANNFADFYDPRYKSIMVAAVTPGVGAGAAMADELLDLQANPPEGEDDASEERVLNSYLRLVRGDAA